VNEGNENPEGTPGNVTTIREYRNPSAVVASAQPRDDKGRFGRFLDTIPPRPCSDVQKREYLEALASGLSVRDACALVGVSRWEPSHWRRDDPEFAAALLIVKEAQEAHYEGELHRLASGDGMPAFNAAIAMLRGLNPERWSPERQAAGNVTNNTINVIGDDALRLAMEARKQLREGKQPDDNASES